MTSTVTGENDLTTILMTLKPSLDPGEYVFSTVAGLGGIPVGEILLFFREQEGITVVVSRPAADRLGLSYTFVAGWITLTVHSSLEAVGLTAAFSKALGDEGISCNVVAAYYHGHIFVNIADTGKAMDVLNRLSTGR